jgi:hypothetical protein
MPFESVVFLEKNKMENMVNIEYDCKCGAKVTGKADRKFTPAEIEELRRRGCGVCYLRDLLEKDLQLIDSENCA